MAYLAWITQKSKEGSRTYLAIRDSSGKVLEYLGRYPTPEAIRAAVARHDVTIAKATKKEE